LGALTEADFSWREKGFKSCLREKNPPRDLCTLRVAGEMGVTVATVELLNGWTDSRTRALPGMEAWMGAWNRTVHSFTSNWRELMTVVHTLKREELICKKLRGKIVFYFTDNKVICNICKQGSSKNLSLHLLVHHLKACTIPGR
jgi:hypothetical protein